MKMVTNKLSNHQILHRRLEEKRSPLRTKLGRWLHRVSRRTDGEERGPFEGAPKMSEAWTNWTFGGRTRSWPTDSSGQAKS
ncbi:hypothetical protein DAI22_05g205300 [Oryza sativa Japonica Group]|nr:hypothetical protein DAI22_05g205300 [Oryza sativa Japonica Group]